MEAFWGFPAWSLWCLIPFLFIGLAALACFFMARSVGRCGCMRGARCGGEDARPCKPS